MQEKVEDQWNGSIYKNPSYTRLQRFFGKKIIDDYVSHNPVTEGMALDVGCGDGYLTSYASEKLGMSFHGIDSSASMIDVAKSHETDKLAFSLMDVVATNLHLYGQYPLIISLLCLHWVIEQDKALKNIRNALKDSGLGYLFISAKSSTPSKNPGYIEIIHELLKEERYASYFSDFSITRAHLTKENYPSMIEKAGLQLNELIEIKEPFIFEDRKELSRFFQGIVSGFLVLNQKIDSAEAFLHITFLCDELVERLIRQGNYTLNDDGTVLSSENFLLAVVQKPSTREEEIVTAGPEMRL